MNEPEQAWTTRRFERCLTVERILITITIILHLFCWELSCKNSSIIELLWVAVFADGAQGKRREFKFWDKMEVSAGLLRGGSKWECRCSTKEGRTKARIGRSKHKQQKASLALQANWIRSSGSWGRREMNVHTWINSFDGDYQNNQRENCWQLRTICAGFSFLSNRIYS